jgi:hypothetical protein
VPLGSTLPERLAQGVAERVVTLVIDSLDLNRLLTRIDLNALIDRLDVEQLVGRIDPDALLDRLDVNALIARVDLDALLDRIDVNALVDRSDLPAMIADTATGTADEVLGAVRRLVARADSSVGQFADRLLGRT